MRRLHAASGVEACVRVLQSQVVTVRPFPNSCLFSAICMTCTGHFSMANRI